MRQANAYYTEHAYLPALRDELASAKALGKSAERIEAIQAEIATAERVAGIREERATTAPPRRSKRA